MLFNSYIFIFVFLPVALAGFFLAGKTGGRTAAAGWLIVSSFFFYAWWNPAYVALLVLSILVNYSIGSLLRGAGERGEGRKAAWAAAIGVALNLGLLGYYKYCDFFIGVINSAGGLSLPARNILLPLAISFFTFQQITYLVDIRRGQAPEHTFLDYCCLVTFFPHLIAGPIVYYKELLPQIYREDFGKARLENFTVGATLFAIGLFKKVIIADGVAAIANPVFTAAGTGLRLTFFEAWAGVLTFTMQIFFDFSGYTDMAIGSARMFGIKLPQNFNSPYKAASIIEFWRRWHITLSRFLRDYLYIPLGGNKKGEARRYANLMATMLIGGLWHGAGWTFVVWGGLHGMYLIVNHLWRKICPAAPGRRGLAAISRLATFLAVAVAWVFFRAQTFGEAMTILSSMSGANGVSMPQAIADRLRPVAGFIRFDAMVSQTEIAAPAAAAWVFFLLLAVWFLPSPHELLSGYEPDLTGDGENGAGRFKWRPSAGWGLAAAAMAAYGVMNLMRIKEFVYFKF